MNKQAMNESNITIQRITTFSASLTENINKMLIQLNEDSIPLSEEEVKDMLDSKSNYLFFAKRKDSDEVLGMATLIVYRIPYAFKGIIEDTVVDVNYRGQGIASKLLEAAIAQAKQKGVKYIDLTSRPSRESANRLYNRLGFVQRETNVYRINL